MENLIRGHGVSGAKILFVGDFPSRIEVQKGYALIGFNEDMLEAMLRSSNGPSIKNSYRTCYIKEEISGFGYNKKFDKEILEKLQPRLPEYKEIILNEIKEVEPNVIVPLGEIALNFIANEIKIDKFRGSVLPLGQELATKINQKLCDRIKVIPTWAMRELIKFPEKKPICKLDISKIALWSNNDEPFKSNSNYSIWVCRNCNDFNAFLGRNLPCEFATFDIETHLGYITCISFCFRGNEAVSIPLMDENIPIIDRVLLFQRIAQLLRSHDIKWVNQNILYDLTVEERYGLCVRNIVGDTMLAQHTLYIEMLKGLDFLTSIYTDIPYYKDEGKEYDPKLGHAKDQLYLYNAKDALATWLIWREQLKEFEEQPTQKAFFFNLNELEHWKNSSSSGYTFTNSKGKNEERQTLQGVMPLFHCYRAINKRGIRIDDEKRKQLRIKYQSILNGYNSDISSITSKEINVRSPKQVQELIYNEFQCPRMFKTNKETGEKTLDSGREALEVICFNKLDENNIEDATKITILKKIIYARKAYKILKYLELPIHPDGRIRTNYKIAGTKSGRTSGSSTIDKLLYVSTEKDKKTGEVKVLQLPESQKQGLGTSFQTIPKHGFIDDEAEDSESGMDAIELGKDIMEIFVPTSSDYVFFDGDKSQAEARIVAVLAEDYDTLIAFNKPRSYIHRLTASWIYKCSPDEITKGTNEYEMGKRARHGGNYDMEAYRFSRMCHIPVNEATIVLSRFHQNQPKIRGIYHATVRDAVRRFRKLVSPYGRQRDIFGSPTDKVMKDFISWIPQSTCSDGTKFSLLRIEAACKDLDIDAKCLMEIHDNLVFEVHKKDVEKFARIYKIEMEKPIDFSHLGTFQRNFELTIPVEMGISEENLKNMKNYNLQ